jgi:hypothetical protein
MRALILVLVLASATVAQAPKQSIAIGTLGVFDGKRWIPFDKDSAPKVKELVCEKSTKAPVRCTTGIPAVCTPAFLPLSLRTGNSYVQK